MAKDRFDSKKWFNSMDSIVEMNKNIHGKVTEEKLTEVNSYYDLKQQYYDLSDNIEFGGIISTLQDIKKKKDTDSFEKIGGIDRELRIWTDIQKLFNKSKLGRIL